MNAIRFAAAGLAVALCWPASAQQIQLKAGTFLPQVWEQLPEPAAFLDNLKRKAGLPPDFWEPGMRLSRYTVAKWSEQNPARP